MPDASPPPESAVPTAEGLVRASISAAASAIVLLVTVVLPAEYAVDPTGLGRVLGLTEMGEIRLQLEREAAEDDHHSGLLPRTPVAPADLAGWASALVSLAVSTAAAQSAETAWTDEVTLTLAPGEGTEVKLTMRRGAVAFYDWTADGGRMNFDLHAHAGGKTASYAKGRGKTGDSGTFTAEFDGNHGWFFRNRDKQPVTVLLKLRGDYSAVVR